MDVTEQFPDGLPATAPLPAAADPDFDQMAALTRRVLDVPYALVTLVTERCQVFPGVAGDLGVEFEQARTNDLSFSLCQYVVRGAKPFVVTDATEVDFLADNRSVSELGIRAYAGMPLVDRAGAVFGSLCVLDERPRDWTPIQLETLHDLAAACSSQFQLREVASRSAVSADRDRIAQELAQSVIHDLFRLSMTLGGLRDQVGGGSSGEVTRAIDTVDAVIARIRSAVYDTGG